MSLVLSTLRQMVDTSRPRNPKLARRPQNRTSYPILDGRKECAKCHEVKNAYRDFYWRTRPKGYQAPHCNCKACEYAALKERRTCGK